MYMIVCLCFSLFSPRLALMSGVPRVMALGIIVHVS